MSRTRPVIRQQPSLGNRTALAQLPRPVDEYPQFTPSTFIGGDVASSRSPRTVRTPVKPSRGSQPSLSDRSRWTERTPVSGSVVDKRPLPYWPLVTGQGSVARGIRTCSSWRWRKRPAPPEGTGKTKKLRPRLYRAQPGHHAATAYAPVSSGGTLKLKTPREFRSGTIRPMKWSRGSMRERISPAIQFGTR